MESVMRTHIRHFATNSIDLNDKRGRRVECHLWDCISAKIEITKNN